MVITHRKNNLCGVSFGSNSPEGLSAPPKSPGAQSIITHDIIYHLKKGIQGPGSIVGAL